jgi:hypothetical protein
MSVSCCSYCSWRVSSREMALNRGDGDVWLSRIVCGSSKQAFALRQIEAGARHWKLAVAKGRAILVFHFCCDL